MKYEFVIYGHYKEPPIFTYDCPHGIQMGQDELERGNKIMGVCPTNSCDKIRVVLAIEPRVFSMCELKWIYIGESYIKHEIIWPTNEQQEQIAKEVSEVMDGLKTDLFVFDVRWLDNSKSEISIMAIDLNDAVKKFKSLHGENNNAKWLEYKIINKEYVLN